METLRQFVNPRTVLGVSVLTAGIVSLISPQAGLWLRCLAVVLGAGGIALIFARTAITGAIAVGAVYLVFSLVCVAGMIHKPDDWGQYVNFGERFCVVLGALAIYTALAAPARGALLGHIARIGLGVCTASFAWAQIVYLQHTVSLVPTWLPPNQLFWTNLTTVAFALAAIAILINVRAKLAMQLMVVMLALFGVVVWVPPLVTHPQSLVFWREIAGNYAIMSAAWAVSEL